MTFLLNLITAAVLYGTPLLYGTSGEILTEKSGNLNLGVEGMMFMGGALGLGAAFYYEKLAGAAVSAPLAVVIAIAASFLAGALAVAACMILIGDSVPGWLLIIIEAVAGIVAGAVWAFIPAFFKARWNTNETLFTLMMNYVATQLVAYFVIIWEVPKGAGKVGIINQSTMAGWLPQIGTNKYLLNVLIVAVITVLMYVYLKYSKHGYEISVVGESERTARYVGIKVDRVIMRTLLLSGAICGIAGLLLVAGTDHTITTTLAGGRGFTAVMVSWLAKFSPVFMVLTSLLLVFLEKGATEISTSCGLNSSFCDILTGVILFFIIGSEFFISYQLHFRKREGKEEKAGV